MINQIIDDEMEKYAKDYVYDNNVYFLNMMDRWIQRTDYRFPLDIKVLEENSQMRQEDVDARFHPIYEHIQTLPEKDRKTARDKTDEEFLKQSRKASQAESSSKIIYFLKENPEGILKALNAALYDLMVQAGDEEYEDFYPPEFEIHYFEAMASSTGMSDLQPSSTGKMKMFQGWVAYFSKISIEFDAKVYKCPACGQHKEGNGKVCPECAYQGKLEFIEKESTGHSVQSIGLMENYEDSRGNPAVLEVFLYGKDINAFFPGDRISVLGIVETRGRKIGNEYRIYFAVKSIQVRKLQEYHLSAEEKQRVMAHRKEIKDLVNGFAPEIIGPYDLIKKALLFQLAGSNNVKRNNIHILLIGDPGLGKSELLRFSSKVSAKGFYISDASSAGLTASIMDINGNRAMMPGVLVLGNNGLAAIDEIEKMKKEDREGIHPALEQGEFTKSKAGLVQTFQTHTSVLAAANPVGSKWDPSRSLIEQISLEPSLLDRFDAIFILESKIMQDIDPISMMHKTDGDISFLRTYIEAAREFPTTMPDETFREISGLYKSLREKSGDLSINIRTFESMLRFTEASAKLNFHSECLYSDFLEMREIMDSWLKQFNYSMDTIRGTDRSIERWYKDAYIVLKAHKKMSILSLKKEIAIDESNFARLLSLMRNSGEFYFPSNSEVRVI